MDYSQDYYAILGVVSGASEEDVRQAYRVAARRFHPDINKAPGADLLFKDINTAYEVLSDQSQRNEYDRVRKDRQIAGGNLIVEALSSRNMLKPLDEPQLLYVLLKTQPRPDIRVRTDAPLNLALVIDRSKSMVATRLQNVKSAVYQIIDECHENDTLSVIAFSDDADVIVPAQPIRDPREIKAMVSAIRADGSTTMLAGLKAGISQVERNRSTERVNHLVLITDGRTYGDEDECIALAHTAREKGIGISGMGIGEDWNDRFLDALASATGGSSTYIVSPETVTRFLQERIRSLATAYAERGLLVLSPATNVELHNITRISPNPMTLQAETQPVPIGPISAQGATTIMLQFHVNAREAELGDYYLGRVDVSGDVIGGSRYRERAIVDLTIQISDQDMEEEPPTELLDALSKLMLYRLQERAREAIEVGDVAQATRSLEFLATRLFETGQEELGQIAMQEARRVAHTQALNLSDEGSKRLKYGTRALLPTTQLNTGE